MAFNSKRDAQVFVFLSTVGNFSLFPLIFTQPGEIHVFDDYKFSPWSATLFNPLQMRTVYMCLSQMKMIVVFVIEAQFIK